MRERLRDLIAERALSTGQFTLASGTGTGYFFDMKQVMLDPEGLTLIAEAFLERIRDEQADHIGGIAMGAVPIVAAVCAFSRATARPRRAFFVRKETKDHGTERRVEGYLPEGGEVL
ncbi:MAG: orotate phosphoribosyltransferase, partial [Alphaproteobacteria bacterium]|nr:orotate phosphoribosyltransferase [Alphaproteobacteria bacterium]